TFRKAHFVFGSTFAALAACQGIENPCPLRQVKTGFFKFKQLFHGAFQNCLLPLFSRQVLAQTVSFEYYSQPFPGIPAEEAKGLFARAPIYKIPLTYRAAGDNLDRINAAGIVFSYANDFLIL